MATDLIASIQRVVTPDLIGRIASGLGVDKGDVAQAASAAIPAILAGLVGVADKPDGAQKIANVLQQSPVTVEEVSSSFSGSEQQSIADHGASMLSALLGGGTSKSLATAIGEYAGLGQGAGKSILGLLAPLVLGVLGQRQRAAGLDAGGIANLLTSQKGAIADALPLGFAEHLSGSGVLDAIGANWRGTSAAAADAANRARAAGRGAYQTLNAAPASSGSGLSSWAIAALALAAIAGGVWLFSGSQSEEVAMDDTAQQTQEGRAVSTPQATMASITQQTTSSLAGLRTALQDIALGGSTEAVMPRLKSAAVEIDKLRAQAAQLPEDGKKRVAVLVTGSMPAINALIDKVLADPEKAESLRPVIEQIRARLQSLSTT